MQHKRFTSSALVAAIMRSVSVIPAFSSVSLVAQLPCTVIMSNCSMLELKTSLFESIRVMSYPSAVS